MAGIGFPLIKMYERSSLTGRVQAVGHAMFIASGPSLMTILCFVLIAALTGGLATQAIVEFRVAAVYAFALAFVVAAPVSLVAVRLVSDAFSRRDFSTLRGTYCVAVVLGALVSALCAGLTFGALSGWDASLFVPAMALTGLVGAVFVAASFATAIREFKAVTTAFGLGAGVSCVLVVAAIHLRLDQGVILMAFHAGFLVAFVGITAPLFATFPDAPRGLVDFARDLAAGVHHHRVLALGGLCGALAIWADKVIIWQVGVATSSGLLHMPRYDSSVFVAYLLIVPGLSMFLVLSETELFRGFRRYQTAVDERGSLGQIDTELANVSDRVTRLIFRLSLVQIFLALIAIIAAPVLIELFGLAYSQLPVLRFLILASAFQFAFLACSAVILFVGDVRTYALLQLAFLALNGGLTIAIQLAAPERTGVGHLAACATAAALAYGAQLRAISNLNADVLARA